MNRLVQAFWHVRQQKSPLEASKMLGITPDDTRELGEALKSGGPGYYPRTSRDQRMMQLGLLVGLAASQGATSPIPSAESRYPYEHAQYSEGAMD